MKKIINSFSILCLTLILGFVACDKNDPLNPNQSLPSAQFMLRSSDAGISNIFGEITIIAGESIIYTNNSSGANSVQWILPGGTPSDPISNDPTVVYNTPGTYDAKLVAINDDGTDTLTCQNCIIVETDDTQTLLNQAGFYNKFVRILKLKPLDSLYGKFYKGGLIFYIDSLAGTGYVAANQDQSTGAVWCGSSSTNISTSSNFGYGYTNTLNIESMCSTIGAAADLCANLNYGGYTDWFLPSYYELFYMYQNLSQKGFGNFGLVNYWTSHDTSSSYASYLNFATGTNGTASKQELYRVRACRTF